jgi:oxepin-CoA hydrolase/3-oxo-5,6-dehydrosuberyl-CoA semialdehyde dehydrogenase
MISIPFDVNDRKLREEFLSKHFLDALNTLTEDEKPLWGKMTAQHMVEHLLWAFEFSTRDTGIVCHTPENLIERMKTFLHDNRPTSHDFRNPILGENPPALRFPSLADAKAKSQIELTRFLDQYRERPDEIHMHPIFGPLTTEEWHRSQYKHCYHHLLQFGIIREKQSVS